MSPEYLSKIYKHLLCSVTIGAAWYHAEAVGYMIWFESTKVVLRWRTSCHYPMVHRVIGVVKTGQRVLIQL